MLNKRSSRERLLLRIELRGGVREERLNRGIIFSETDSSKCRLIIFGAALSENLEAKDLRLVVVYLGREDNSCGEVLQENLRERSAENATIEIEITLA